MSMIWAHSEWLNALWAIPAFIVLWVAHSLWSRSARQKLGPAQLQNDWIVRSSKWRIHLRNALAIGAVAAGIIAVANPQKKGEEIEIEKTGLDVVFAIDMSKSMLAKDIAPSRLEQAKQFARRVIDESANNRIGIVAFSNGAYKQLPITSDQAAAKMILNSMNPSNIPGSGSDFSTAIATGISMFDNNVRQDRALVIISDGEDHPREWQNAANYAVDSGLYIYTVGVGTSAGGPIPIAGTDKFHKDRNGEVVITKRETGVLREIASNAGGQYYDGNYTDNAEVLIKDLEKLKLAEFGISQINDMEDQFQLPLSIAILLLLIRSLLSERSTNIYARWMERA